MFFVLFYDQMNCRDASVETEVIMLLKIRLLKSIFIKTHRDKTMADKWMYIPSHDKQNYPFCRLQFVDETFGHSAYWTNQSKFNLIPQSCYAND